MRVEQEKVAAFHEKHGYPVSATPTRVPMPLALQRAKFLLEEGVTEYLDAAEDGDLAQIADALADAVYILLGTANVHGIDLQPIFDEVHRSNMTKTPLDPVTKKGGKGDGYEPPAIAALLLVQATKLDAGGKVLQFP